MNKKPTYIIFGASGDLSKRYLMPATSNLEKEGYIDRMVPVSRKDYDNLKNLINKDDAQSDKIFHLAVPPQGVIDAVKIINQNFGRDGVKIMLEKPFGDNLESAQSLIEHIDQYFLEEQIYRVDHYLAKESLQNVITEDWKKDDVSSIEIIAIEKIDIEGRVNFYEQTGALKDFVQSHLIEMASVVLAGSFDIKDREKALRNLEIVCDVSKHECVKRGQYEGYREEVGNKDSMTETFVSINLSSRDPIWRGVSINLTTGKALNEKLTQIKIKYKNGGEKIFNIEHEPKAYERVMKATILGDRNLFISSTEVLESWRILEAIQDTWKQKKDDLLIYKKGSSLNEVIGS